VTIGDEDVAVLRDGDVAWPAEDVVPAAVTVTRRGSSAAGTRTDFTRRACVMWSSRKMRPDCMRIGAAGPAFHVTVLRGLTRCIDDGIVVVVGGRAGRMFSELARGPGDGGRAI
jgi:hypothetical protein